MNNFSFFRFHRGGGNMIRAGQISNYLDGRINPESGFENDVCIYVLGMYRTDGPEVQYAYYDVMDCQPIFLNRMLQRTRGDIIAVSLTQHDLFREMFPTRKVYFIPQHHCNFYREKRPDRPITTVGCIGDISSVQYDHNEVARMLSDIGLKWKFKTEFMRRRRVVEFYKDIDIQISFRPQKTESMLHKNPLKLSNAGSFGIPTVSFPEPAYKAEWKGGGCLWGESMQDIMSQVKRLKDDPVLYKEISGRAVVKSEKYHIDNIAPLYKMLPPR